MRPPLRAAFVLTTSVVSLAACHGQREVRRESGSCEPPDCHINPPPTPTPSAETRAPPVVADADVPLAQRINPNPPPMRDAGAKR